MPQLSKTILVKLVECILQSRVDIQKKQIRRFDEINKQLQKKREKAFDGNFEIFFSNLLLQEKYKIAQLVKSQAQHHYIRISFSLCDRFNKKNIIMAEEWSIAFDEYLDFEEEYSKDEYVIVSTLFEEMLLFLNQQPLFSEYQRNSKIKDKYSINYQIQLLTETPEHLNNQSNLLLLGNKYIKERVCRYIGVNIICYFLPKSQNCWNSYDNQLYFQNKSTESKKQEKTCDTVKKNRKQSQSSIVEYGKTSYYEIYDKQLDFVFLSSDDEEFRHRLPESEIREVNLDLEESQEFELLMMSKDEELVNDNKDLVSQFVSLEKQYLIM